jgi:hypothetical protein
MRNAILLIIALGGLAVIAGVWAVQVWGGMGGVEMSIHGWIALGLGVLFTLGIGGGLMALAFFSSKRGYDDQVGEFNREDF